MSERVHACGFVKNGCGGDLPHRCKKRNTKIIYGTKTFCRPLSVKAYCHKREFAVAGESVDVGHHHMVTIFSNACKQRLGPVALRAAVSNPSENDGDTG